MRTHRGSFPYSVFGPSSRFAGLLWPLLTSAQSHHGLLQGALPLIPALLPCFAHTAKAASRYAQACFTSGLTGFLLEQVLRLPVGQISPDKDVNFLHTTAAFTISPEPWALLCCANLPGDLALYAVPVRRLMDLHSGFLQTLPHGNALAFG